jgi:hypothetical protein
MEDGSFSITVPKSLERFGDCFFFPFKQRGIDCSEVIILKQKNRLKQQAMGE